MVIDSLLEPFAHFGVRLGLEAIQALLENLGNPQEQVPIVHVAGTNGKGSVCAYVASIVQAAGYRVGRYTSPHLVDWTERICVDGEPIAPEALAALLQRITVVARSQTPVPTQFEIMTAAAFLHFAQQEVDLAVVEVGLGGRLDSTNVCDQPLVSVITSIGYDHCQVLGHTLAEIAWEKAGILKAECPAVIGPLPPEANAVVYRRAATLGCSTVYPEMPRQLANGWLEYRGIEEYEFEPHLDEVEAAEDPDEIGLVHMLTAVRYRVPLPGAVQQQNSALAIAVAQVLREQGWEIPDEAVVDGIAKTRWPGRLQWVQWRDRRLLVDGAHNPPSAEVLRAFVDEQVAQGTFSAPIHWVLGMLANKDHQGILQALLRPGDRLYVVPVPDHLTADPDKLVSLAQSLCPDLAAGSAYADVETALAAATGVPDQSVVLCGSLYLVGRFLGQVAPPQF